MKLLAKSPEDRYSSADEVHTLLERCLAHVQQPTVVELPLELQLKSKSRSLLQVMAVVVVCLGIACGIWRITQRSAAIDSNRADIQPEPVLNESLLYWEGDESELESLRSDFSPIELKSKKLWDVEPNGN